MTATIVERVIRKAATAALHLVGWAPVYYVAQINLSASKSQGPEWADAAIVSTVFAAFVFEVAILFFKRGRYAACGAMLVVAVPFLALGALVASGNVASIDKQASDAQSAQATKTTILADQRADAVKRRDAAEKAAEGQTEQTALETIEKLKVEQARHWNSSQHCDPTHTTFPGERQLCNAIKALEIKAAAAKAYREAREEIAKIDGNWNTKTAPVQSTGKGAAANLVAFVAMTGHTLKEDEAEKIFEWWRGGCLELMGAMSPGLMNLFAWLLFGAGETKAAEAPKRRASVPVSEPKPKRRARLASLVSSVMPKRKEAEIIAFPAGSAEDFHQRFLEPSDDPEATIKSGDVERRYKERCAQVGVKPMSGKMLSLELQKLGVKHTRTPGNRSYYHGVRLRDVPAASKQEHRGPRIVIDNTASVAAAAC